MDTTQTDQLLRLLDTAVIKLEGGNDDDLKVLDEKAVEIKPIEQKFEPIIVKPAVAAAPVPRINAADEDWSDLPHAEKSMARKKPANDEENWSDDDGAAEKAATLKNSKNPFARKTEKGVTNDDWKDIPEKLKVDKKAAADEDGENWDEDDDYPKATTIPKTTVTDTASKHSNDENSDNEEDKNNTSNETENEKIVDDKPGITSSEPHAPAEKKRRRSRSNSSSSSSSSSESEDEESAATAPEKQPQVPEIKSENVDADVKMLDEPSGEVPTNEEVQPSDKEEAVAAEPAAISKDATDEKNGEKTENGNEKPITTEEGEEEDDEEKVETIDLDKETDPKDDEPKPRALHKTSSIFLRNLAPTITKSEVEAMCKRYSGFLRVAIADPLVERRWFRRGWVTFQRDVNIKEICWNLNNIRLRDCELGAIVNRDLSRRVRPINGITAHKTIVRSDIKLCAKIAYNLDVKASLWQSEQDKMKTENGGKPTFGLNSNNPVLQNITDYLIEEASAEEDELLGLSTGDNKDSDGELLERDPELLLVLDKLILYMRIVHSVDFYNHCEYPYEDEMPNRLGIIHARGPAPQNKVTSTEIQDYIRNFETKMASFLTKSQPIEEVELKKFGCKDVDAEVEKFVQANTQELAKDKWLCPLSGKKFKGPDFIRKHIFNKHAEKVDEVKKEVEYFNNYLKDAKRPQLPEHPGNTRKPASEMQQQPGLVWFFAFGIDDLFIVANFAVRLQVSPGIFGSDVWCTICRICSANGCPTSTTRRWFWWKTVSVFFFDFL